MVLQPPPLLPTPGNSESTSQRAKYRLRFRKGGDLRLVSHHDLMNCFERMLRRAALPLCTTQGFHPQPRMIFAQSLALGILGSAEVLELELTRAFSPQEIQEGLNRQAPRGLEILSVKAMDFRACARVRRAFYRLTLPPEMAEPWPSRCTDLLTQDTIWVERTRPRPRRFNLRPYIHQLFLLEGALEMALWVTPHGAARPEEVALLLGLESWLQDGAFFERTFLELLDEIPPGDEEKMPACLLTPASSSKVESLPAGTPPEPSESTEVRPTTLVAGPLSFDS